MTCHEATNSKGVVVKSGSYWTVDSPANDIYPDQTWIMKIDHILDNHLVSVAWVNWKRKGVGFGNCSRMLDDFGTSWLRKATPEEITYFDKRMEKYKGRWI
jgi:hypothetical protein